MASRPLIYLAIKYHENQKNRKEIETLTKSIEESGYESYCVARDLENWGDSQFTPQELMRHSFKKINQAKYLLVELSEKGVGLGIEVGYAFARGIPVLIHLPDHAALSTTMEGIAFRIYRYQQLEEVKDFLSSLDKNKPRS